MDHGSGRFLHLSRRGPLTAGDKRKQRVMGRDETEVHLYLHISIRSLSPLKWGEAPSRRRRLDSPPASHWGSTRGLGVLKE